MNEVYSHDRVKGFLHADGTRIVNGDGEEVILRGWGMGNWDNPEAFMLGIQNGFDTLPFGAYAPMGRMDRGRAMDLILRETCGSAYAEGFWDRWHRAYLAEADIKALAGYGYNSVRLPVRACSFLKEEPGIHFLEEAFRMLDDVLAWCEKYRVYAILDVHAATAGQSCIPCDDGMDNAPHFYIDEDAMERMHLLMEEFAKRYGDRWILGGYDCLNEPLSVTPRREELTPALQEFYAEMVRRCRKFDKNHLFLLNGTQFSTLVDLFDRDFDPEYHNWGISLHCYEMVSPEMVSLSDALKKCREWNVPLWMGETGGRNEHAWQTTMFELLDEHHAGFNLWCWKTCAGAGCASAVNFTVPGEWSLIVNYATKGGPKPSYEHAQRIWDDYLECVKLEHCTENLQYHPYILRQGSFEIPAIGYNDLPAESRRGCADLPCSTNYRLSDRMEIVFEQGFQPPASMPGMPGKGHLRSHMHLRLRAGEYVSYSVRTEGAYTVGAFYCADASVTVRVNAGERVLFEGELPAAAEKPLPGRPDPLFPQEAAANGLAQAEFGSAAGPQLLRLEVLSGQAGFGSILIRESKESER